MKQFLCILVSLAIVSADRHYLPPASTLNGDYGTNALYYYTPAISHVSRHSGATRVRISLQAPLSNGQNELWETQPSEELQPPKSMRQSSWGSVAWVPKSDYAYTITHNSPVAEEAKFTYDDLYGYAADHSIDSYGRIVPSYTNTIENYGAAPYDYNTGGYGYYLF